MQLRISFSRLDRDMKLQVRNELSSNVLKLNLFCFTFFKSSHLLRINHGFNYRRGFTLLTTELTVVTTKRRVLTTETIGVAVLCSCTFLFLATTKTNFLSILKFFSQSTIYCYWTCWSCNRIGLSKWSYFFGQYNNFDVVIPKAAEWFLA